MPKKNLKKTASSRLTPLEIHRYIWADIWLPLSGRKTWVVLAYISVGKIWSVFRISTNHEMWFRVPRDTVDSDRRLSF